MARPFHELSATEIAEGVRSGAFGAEAVAESCLERISARDGTVMAWEFLDPELVRRQARAIGASGHTGAMAGVPVGIKDIIDTSDMPTEMGSPIYGGNRPERDADCVALLRAAGAVIVGKTVTCEFAGLTPGRTANPHDPGRSPGGSSSGSAAAVADRMVPVALGTQTGGSVIRPSSYCGILGYKPSFGTFGLAGVFPAAPSLDTLGLHARTVDDLGLAASALTGRAAGPIVPPATPPAIGVARTWLWDDAQPETRRAVEDAARGLEAAGARVSEAELPGEFRELAGVRGTINAVERAATLRDAWAGDRERISAGMRKTVEEGLAVSRSEYEDALGLMEACRKASDAAFGDCDIFLTPAVDGEAPPGLGDTGSPRFQALWTMLRTPAVTVPAGAGPGGLPVGIQLVARYRQDDLLLRAARWAGEVLL